jgi:leucyl aminopeptidase
MQARDLVNEPAGEMTPSQMAEVARHIAKEHGLEVKVLGPRECEKLGMGMFLAVARGSDEEPRLIHLSYRPRGKAPARKRIALIGKGVTFDSGGLSLKQSASMETMKTDMSGAAAVLSAIGVLAELGVPYEVHAVAACTENMPSGKAYKLGDVLRSMSGRTVEINNTDAEGRLTLGDAITYAIREARPDELFDFATLTGACIVALGPHVAGVMGSDLSLIERWLAAARLAGEDMWHLPLPERLKEQLKSEIADMKNTGERPGGALTAGLFLREFVGDTPWVHVDLAGPANADKEFAHVGKGGTGFGVATIVEYLAGRE